MSQRELAEVLGISAGSVHYVLRALIEAGVIKLCHLRDAGDKRRYAYLLTPAGVAEKAEGGRRFLARKVAEFEALREEIDALQAELGAVGTPVVSGCEETLVVREMVSAGEPSGSAVIFKRGD